MMKQNLDQLEKFQEDVCKWDIFTDILPHKDEAFLKSTYYTAEDYILT